LARPRSKSISSKRGADSADRNAAESAFQRGFLIQEISKLFGELEIGASIHRNSLWLEVHATPSVLDFELEHGILNERYVYNERLIRRARREGKALIGMHAGFADLFVPIQAPGGSPGVLVVGPFSRQRPSTTDILERWHALTGRQGHPADAEFMHYLGRSLSTVVFEGKRLTQFQRLIECLAGLMVATSADADLVTEVETLIAELSSVHLVERIWEAARSMVDGRTSRAWSDPARFEGRKRVGLTRFPEHVVVGLFVSQRRDLDPVEDLVRRNAFQRACVELGRTRDNVVCGKIGDHGVTFLGAGSAPAARARRRLLELGEAAAAIGKKRFGLNLHLGTSSLSAPLPAVYQAALSAAETALSGGVAWIDAQKPTSSRSPLARLRQELATVLIEKPQSLPARFDEFLEVLAIRCRYRFEPALAQLEATFERIAEALSSRGIMDAKDLDLLLAGLEQSSSAAGTVSELFAVYRRAIRDVVQALESPQSSRHDRNLRRAEEYVRQHYAEPLGLEQVARAAGFAPSYFSRVFHRKRGVTFKDYLVQLRLQRAKELLVRTSLSLPRIAQLSGFSRGEYLNRVFKRENAETPIEYRWRALYRKRPVSRRRRRR
jgi:AraC-like DNA-binding protein